ncbi:TetR/AcrR family transcriptional regulator [Rhodococcus sp. D2-41]|uniref:TetR/AcrR family transcriptional regulator n=1 Tax=Speluncibacter jeojiensis TaxID=2710754 RepID=A0A9X4M1H0_9ACTN|nr:TetR/AcrR family transcriptional regulator [Rhodococcus sp. D2-41]MDG3011584.1 TetR/AcrR family transcriptional regulator [Rhodococcus sp. D2-41]MDG3015059.1 TetR/AcrR family transcriptional regulator [Corynebacteriales bacterium D3-21]
MASDVAPRRQRLEPDERRKQILDCAIRLFGERPYADVSTVELAREAGVARGLINHYFGTKRDLYLEVVRAMVIVPPSDQMVPPAGSLRKKIDWFLDWFLDMVGRHGQTWLAAIGAEGIANDAEVQSILAEADDLAADRVLAVVGLDPGASDGAQLQAMTRAYGGMVKAAVREWLDRKTLTRSEVHILLRQTLLGLVKDVYPRVVGEE